MVKAKVMTLTDALVGAVSLKHLGTVSSTSSKGTQKFMPAAALFFVPVNDKEKAFLKAFFASKQKDLILGRNQ